MKAVLILVEGEDNSEEATALRARRFNRGIRIRRILTAPLRVLFNAIVYISLLG